jgi:hypothetical protein
MIYIWMNPTPMFRKVSYLTMVVLVLLSWGMILNVAERADQVNGTDITPALRASVHQNIQAYLAKLNPSPTALAGTGKVAVSHN